MCSELQTYTQRPQENNRRASERLPQASSDLIYDAPPRARKGGDCGPGRGATFKNILRVALRRRLQVLGSPKQARKTTKNDKKTQKKNQKYTCHWTAGSKTKVRKNPRKFHRISPCFIKRERGESSPLSAVIRQPSVTRTFPLFCQGSGLGPSGQQLTYTTQFFNRDGGGRKKR